MRRKEDATAKHGKQKTNVRRFRLAVYFVLVSGWLLFVTINVVAPTQSEPSNNIDAVVSLAPQYDRLATAEQIFYETRASHLLVSYFPNDRYLAGPGTGEEDIELVATYCMHTAPAHVTCATPEHATTLGEASMINAVADTGSWEAMTVVTSKYHAFRTRLILDRCIDSDLRVEVVFSEVHLSAALWLRYIFYENAAYLKAQLETLFRC